MNAIRKQLLISSLNINYKYNKYMSKFLSLFKKDNQKIQDSFNSDSLLNILLKMISIEEFSEFSKDMIILEEIIGSFNNEQKKQFYKTLIETKDISKDIFSNNYLMSNCTIEILGDLIYDINFLKCFEDVNEKIAIIPMDIMVSGNNSFHENVEKIDIEKILNNDELFNFYSKYTSLFISPIKANFSEKQLEQLVDERHYWALQLTDLKFDQYFVEKILIENPTKSRGILAQLPESIKNDKNIILSLLLAQRIDALSNEQLKKENLYSVFIDQVTKKEISNNFMSCKDVLSDSILYSILMYDFLGNNIVLEQSLEDIYMDCSDDEKKNICLAHPQMQNNIEIDKEILKYQHKRLTPKIIKELLYVNNKVFGNKISNEQIDLFLKNNDKIIKKITNHDDYSWVLGSEKIINNLYHSICNNSVDLFSRFFDLECEKSVCMYYITPELINELGEDLIAQIAVYPENFYCLIRLQKEGKLKLYKQLLANTKNIPLDFMRINNTLIYSCLAFPNLITKMINNGELNSKNILNLINITQMYTVETIDNLDSIEQYYSNLENLCDKNINYVKNSLMIKELICQRFCGINFSFMNEFYNSFKDCGTKNENVINLLNLMEKLIKIEDSEELQKIYEELNQKKFKTDFLNITELITNLKEEIIGTICKKTYQTESKIIDMTGKKFQGLIHVFGAYGSTINAKSIKESWNSNSRITNSGICTSLLNENYLGHATREKSSVILGFDNIPSTEVQMMAPYDLGSSAYGMKTISYSIPKYYSSEDLLKNARANHNEVVINRNLPGGEKRQPNYILCFDTINKESQKASEEFGIPIIFIDVKKHLELKLQEIEMLKQEFSKTQSIDIMKKIIDTQESMRCGLIANNSDLVDSYFNTNIITNNILFLINNCNNIDLLNQLEILINKENNRVGEIKKIGNNIEFNGDMDLITNSLKTRKSLISNENLKNEREKQIQQDKVTRKEQLTGMIQEMSETKEGYSL